MGVMDGNRDGFNFGTFLLPAEDGFADSRHGDFGYFAGALGAFVNNFKNAALIVFPLYAAVADGGDPFDQVVGHFCFALNAADASGAAAFGGPVQSGLRRKQFMPIVDGADVRVAGVGAALAGRVGDHDFGFFADVVVGFGEGDGVAVGLGHLAAVQAWDTRGLGEHYSWLGQ